MLEVQLVFVFFLHPPIYSITLRFTSIKVRWICTDSSIGRCMFHQIFIASFRPSSATLTWCQRWRSSLEDIFMWLNYCVHSSIVSAFNANRICAEKSSECLRSRKSMKRNPLVLQPPTQGHESLYSSVIFSRLFDTFTCFSLWAAGPYTPRALVCWMHCHFSTISRVCSSFLEDYTLYCRQRASWPSLLRSARVAALTPLLSLVNVLSRKSRCSGDVACWVTQCNGESPLEVWTCYPNSCHHLHFSFSSSVSGKCMNFYRVLVI